MVVLVRDENPVLGGVEGDSSWSEEFSRS